MIKRLEHLLGTKPLSREEREKLVVLWGNAAKGIFPRLAIAAVLLVFPFVGVRDLTLNRIASGTANLLLIWNLVIFERFNRVIDTWHIGLKFLGYLFLGYAGALFLALVGGLNNALVYVVLVFGLVPLLASTVLKARP